jgi:hypothetical protein
MLTWSLSIWRGKVGACILEDINFKAFILEKVNSEAVLLEDVKLEVIF